MLDVKEKSHRIKQARSDAGLTQEEMATALGMTASSVQKWESGGVFPRFKVLKKISELTGKTLDFFVDSAEMHPLVAWEPKIAYDGGEALRDVLGRIEKAQKELAEAHHFVRAMLGS